MDEATQQQAPAKTPITKEERSKIMSEAAKRRWAKAKRAKAKAAKPRPAPVAVKAKKHPSAPREFSSALKMAEKRLAKAIQERAEAAAKYAVVSAEIPSLQRIILALKNQNPMGETEYGGYYTSAAAAIYNVPAAPTLEQIVGDQPLPYQNPLPPRRDIPAQPQPVPVMPIPQELHPANTLTVRGGGGAIGVELDEGGGEDEDKFLNESAVSGGQWH